MDHCFISYSNAESEPETTEFAFKLADKLKAGPPSIDVWIDNRSMNAGENWDIQVRDAIKSCKCLLFVVSTDSVTDSSICGDEWSLALRYKKTIIPLILNKDAEVPFRLSRRKYIDFTEKFETKLAELRNHIAWLDSPEGVLQSLKENLEDAKRDLQRNPENRDRINVDIENLDKQYKQQSEIVKNPEKAKKQTRKQIDIGLKHDREPINQLSYQPSSKFINPRPGSIPDYFEGRLIETEQIADFLKNDYERIMTINGRAGSGKTVLATRVLQYLEKGRFPNELGEFKVGGIVYLSEIGNYKINVPNFFSGLLQLIESDKAKKVEKIYREGKIPVDEKIRSLLIALPAEPVIVLMDNFEDLLTSINGDVLLVDQELLIALKTILQAGQNNLKILITTRELPRSLNLIEAPHQNILHLDEGLKSPYAENVLRKMDKDGHLGFRDADNELLGRVRVATLGYPKALEAFYGILQVDRYSNIEELLVDGVPDTVVQIYVGEAFSRLDTTSQKIIQTLAIYNRPVSSAAIDFALQVHIPGINSEPILDRLVSMHFARREAKRYFLHPADREYALSRIPKGNFEGKVGKGARAHLWDQHSLTLRAADYFIEVRKPRGEWKKLDDLAPQLAEFDLRYVAKDFDKAAQVLLEIDFNYLMAWGESRLMIDFHEKLKGNLIQPDIISINIHNLGVAYSTIGEINTSILYLQSALELAKKNKSEQNIAAVLINLGNNYSHLGDVNKTIEYYEQGLIIARSVGDYKGEADVLNNLGTEYRHLGNLDKSLEYQIQSLNLTKQKIEGRSSKSICKTLTNISLNYLELGEFQKAEENLKLAIQIADEFQQLDIQMGARGTLAQNYLYQNDLINAQSTINSSLQYKDPVNVYHTTNLKGIITLRQGDRATAQEAFSKSIAQADEILAKTPDYYSALDAKGLALAGLTICDLRLPIEGRGRDEFLSEAVETFRKARKIAPHAGVVKSVLRLFDELMKCEGGENLKDVRKVISGE